MEPQKSHDEAVRQVALANQIRISKLDLVDARDISAPRLLLELRQINPSAEIAEVDWSSAAVTKLLTSPGFDSSDPHADPRPWLDLQAYQNSADVDACGHDHQHGHGDHHHSHGGDNHNHLKGRGIENFVLTRESPLSRAESQFLLEGIAQNLGAGLLRVKGLINIAEEPGRPAVIQGAQHLLHTMTWLDRWPDDDHRTRVVFITQGIARESLRDIIDLLDRVSSRTFKARARGQRAQEAAKATTQTQ